MGRRELSIAGLVLVSVISVSVVSRSAMQAAEPVAVPNFEDDVLPILNARCLKCHGGESTKAGLDVRRRFAMLSGGDSGASIVINSSP